jgi:DNA-binding PadR family transcriptional regulator
MTENYREEIVQRIIRNLLDIQLLRLIDAQPLWGYMIKKKTESEFHIKLRHGALYPTLNRLETQGFVTRKVYTSTEKGKEYLQSYYSILKEQLGGANST